MRLFLGGVGGSANSRCFSLYSQLDNPQSAAIPSLADPSCFLINPNPLTFTDAEQNCLTELGFLATMKEETARSFLSQLVANNPTTEHVYIG